jgi:hypothetical protein
MLFVSCICHLLFTRSSGKKGKFEKGKASSRGRRSMAIDYLGMAGATGIVGIMLTLVSADHGMLTDKSSILAKELQPVALRANAAPCPPMAAPTVKHARLEPLNLLPDIQRRTDQAGFSTASTI